MSSKSINASEAVLKPVFVRDSFGFVSGSRLFWDECQADPCLTPNNGFEASVNPTESIETGIE